MVVLLRLPIKELALWQVTNPQDEHQFSPQASFNGGDLDCGSGLLFMIRKHLDPLIAGQLLEIISTETSVEEELPAWCRLTGNELVSWTKKGKERSFLISKGHFDGSGGGVPNGENKSASPAESLAIYSSLDKPTRAASNLVQTVQPLSVMGIGSWPRPSWLLESLHQYLEGRLAEVDFQRRANDATRLSVTAQLRAGVDVVTDGEQRRDNYASFVGQMLTNCQLVPLTDLLPLVDNPEKFQAEMNSLDVPASKVRHPAVFGRIKRNRPLTLGEFDFVSNITDKPVKVSLPGPYLLTRTMWMDCISDKVYTSREALAEDIVQVLREELTSLLESGVSLVQLDEPVLTEVVFSGPQNTRSFMCGALSESYDVPAELAFARHLIQGVVAGMPTERIALHICRGNWTANESKALQGDYSQLLPILKSLAVGTMFLEFCTPRAGDLNIIKELPQEVRIGIGVVNPKTPRVETLDEVLAKARSAINLVGRERILLTPDCGFATFADSPVADAAIAESKLAICAKAALILRGEQ